jgi:CRISPR/Cas system-associated protein Csx1
MTDVEGGSREQKDYQKRKPYLSDQKRNFYAHAGLSENEAEVRAAAGRVFLRYSEKRLKEIESWLMKPW